MYYCFQPAKETKLDVDDPRLVDYCNLAIDKYNSKRNTCYKYVKTISASEEEHARGSVYRIVFQAKIDDEQPVTIKASLYDGWNMISVVEVEDYPA
ncbi:hypothetical protein LIER_13853 [Lithospermum erythrorhizon]|uniref:Cysteine proteinase inhibitor n=1 Tax=Lithospermum erythrorhizon TaxID=34254 RepID=A0AAV3Q142_LITER